MPLAAVWREARVWVEGDGEDAAREGGRAVCGVDVPLVPLVRAARAALIALGRRRPSSRGAGAGARAGAARGIAVAVAAALGGGGAALGGLAVDGARRLEAELAADLDDGAPVLLAREARQAEAQLDGESGADKGGARGDAAEAAVQRDGAAWALKVELSSTLLRSEARHWSRRKLPSC